VNAIGAILPQPLLPVHLAVGVLALLVLFIVIDEWLGTGERRPSDSDDEL
jgi:hypothetical protein